MSNTAGKKLVQEIQDQFLVCKICFEPYRQPKTLTCLHTFCVECLEHHLEAEMERSYRYMLYTRSITCPICRKKTDVPTGGIKRLPDNFVVESLTDIVSRRKGTEKGPSCEICPGYKRAVLKCLDCVKLLCESCVELHRRTKVTSGHSLFDVETERDIACKVHADECVRFYCEPCEMCICVVCTFQEHKGHEVFSFNEGLAKYRHCLDELTQSCKSRITELRSNIDLIGKCENELKFTEEQIRDTAISSISAIRRREKQMVDELYTAYGAGTLQFLKAKQGFQNDLDNLVNTCNLTDIIIKDNSIELLLLKKDIQCKLGEILDRHLDDAPDNLKNEIKFVPGTMILGHLQVGEEDLGDLVSKDHKDPIVKCQSMHVQTECTEMKCSETTMGLTLLDYNFERCTQTQNAALADKGNNTTTTPSVAKETSTTSLISQSHSQTMTDQPPTKRMKVQTDPWKGCDRAVSTVKVALTDKGSNTAEKKVCERSTLTIRSAHTNIASDTTGLITHTDQSTGTVTPNFTHTGTCPEKVKVENKSTGIDHAVVADKMIGTPKVTLSDKEVGTPRVLTLDMGNNTCLLGENKATSTRVIVTTDSFTGLGDVRTCTQATETERPPQTRTCGTSHEIRMTDKMVSAMKDYCDVCTDAWRGQVEDAGVQSVADSCDVGITVCLPCNHGKPEKHIEQCEQGINTDLLPLLRPTTDTETSMKSMVFSVDSSTATERVIIKPWVEVKSIGVSADLPVTLEEKKAPVKTLGKTTAGPVSSAKNKLLKTKSIEDAKAGLKDTKADASSGTDSPGLANAVAALINSVSLTAAAPFSKTKSKQQMKDTNALIEKLVNKPKMVDASTTFESTPTSDSAVGPDEVMTPVTKEFGVGVNLPNCETTSVGTGMKTIVRQDSATETNVVSLNDTSTSTMEKKMVDKQMLTRADSTEQGTLTDTPERKNSSTSANLKHPTREMTTNTKPAHLINTGTSMNVMTHNVKVGTRVQTSDVSMETNAPVLIHKMVGTLKPKDTNKETNTPVISTADKQTTACRVSVRDAPTMTSLPETSTQATGPHRPFTRNTCTATTPVDRKHKGLTARAPSQDIGLQEQPNMVSRACGTRAYVLKYQDQGTNTPLPSNIDKDSLGKLYEEFDTLLESVKIRSIDSGTFSSRLKQFQVESPTGEKPKASFNVKARNEKGVSAIAETKETGMGTYSATLTESGTSTPSVTSADRAVSPIVGLGLISKTTSTPTLQVTDSGTGMPSREFTDSASNTQSKSMIDRAATPIRTPTSDSGIMATVATSSRGASTMKIATTDSGTAPMKRTLLNSATCTPQLIQVEKETATPTVHLLHKNLGTDATLMVDANTCMSDVTATYRSQLTSRPPRLITRGTSMTIPEGQDKSTSPIPTGPDLTEKASSPIRFPTSDKGVSVRKGELLEPHDKFQTAGSIANQGAVKLSESNEEIFRPNLASIREDSQEWDDEEGFSTCEDDDDVFEPAPTPPQRRKKMVVQQSNFVTTGGYLQSDTKSVFSTKGQGNSNIMCTVEMGTNTSGVAMETKETSTPPLETEDKGTATDLVTVGGKMAECISKLKQVRQRLEQPTPPSTPTRATVQQPSLSSGCISSSEESEAGHKYQLNRLKSKSCGERLHAAREFGATGRQMSSESLASYTASDSGMDVNQPKPKLARKQRLDMTQLLRSSSAPEKENPPFALPKPKLQLQAVQRQVIPKLNIEEIANKSMNKSIKIKKKIKHRPKESEESRGSLSSPEGTPQMRRRTTSGPQPPPRKDVFPPAYLADRLAKTKLWERRVATETKPEVKVEPKRVMPMLRVPQTFKVLDRPGVKPKAPVSSPLPDAK